MYAKTADETALCTFTPPPAAVRRPGGAAAAYQVPFTANHALLLSLAAAWAATALLGLLPPASLALDRARPWTVLSDAWLSPGVDLLARNLFFGYVFGRVVDNVEGGQGLWLSYVLSAAGWFGAVDSELDLRRWCGWGGCCATACLAVPAPAACSLLSSACISWGCQ
jgi:hypothetical protein